MRPANEIHADRTLRLRFAADLTALSADVAVTSGALIFNEGRKAHARAGVASW